MRIVSLCPSLTELVFDLGASDELVGITKFCVHPKDGVARIEKVGGTKNPKVERIIELRPDLVLLNEEENRIEDERALRAAHTECLTTFPKTVEETADSVRVIGKRLGRPKPAEAMAALIDQKVERLRSLRRAPVSFAYLIWRNPWMTVNADTYIAAMLSLAGGRNVFADRAARYPEVSANELGAAAPEVVLLSSEPYPFDETHAVELSGETGIPQSRVRLVDGEYLSWHGSRTPAGLDYCENLIGECRSHAH